MILESLAEMARREGLVDEPAFQSMPVRWVVDIDEQGCFESLIDTGYEERTEGKKKPRTLYPMRKIPRRSGRTSGDQEEFLVDKSDYVLGFLPDGADGGERSLRRQRMFAGALARANADVQSPALTAVLAFLQSDDERQRCVDQLAAKQFVSNDLFTFRVGDTMLDEEPVLRNWWAERVAETSQAGDMGQCLLCGNRKAIVDKHDSLKLPGAVTSGVALVSFNSGAFEKYGLERNENAPICRDCMVAYVNGLRRCLEPRYPKPHGGSFSQQSMRLSEDTVAVYWDDASSGISSALHFLSDGPGEVKALLESPWKGLSPAAPEARFYCLILTGTQGRASVRGMHTSTLGKVVENLIGEQAGKRGYFTCIEAAGYREEPAPIKVLEASLAVQGKLDSLPPGIASEVFLSAVMGHALSPWFLAATVGRTRAERTLTRPRAALLHLYFQRHPNLELRKTPMSLDVETLDPAYRYGRLLAVLERLQIRALKRTPNSTIVDRFYAAASTRPATAFPRLISLAQNHLRSLNVGAGFFSGKIEEIVAGLDGAKGFRPTLNLEEQGRFALGYFHQKNALYGSSAQADAAEDTPNNETEETQQ
jgi:CRISPR-associated protein Csd1